MGKRYLEPVTPYVQLLAPGRDAALLFDDLSGEADETRVVNSQLRHSEHRHILRRVQITVRHPYAEIRDDTFSADILLIDLLCAKMLFFGVCHFEPRSDRWVRVTMFRNAPFPHELAEMNFADWTYPALVALKAGAELRLGDSAVPLLLAPSHSMPPGSLGVSVALAWRGATLSLGDGALRVNKRRCWFRKPEQSRYLGPPSLILKRFQPRLAVRRRLRQCARHRGKLRRGWRQRGLVLTRLRAALIWRHAI